MGNYKVTANYKPEGAGAESAELSSTPITDDANFGIIDRDYYSLFTLPSTEDWYIITAIEWKNGATVAGNIMCGVRKVDAAPPTRSSTELVAWGEAIAASGTSTVQKNSKISSTVIRKGTLLGAFIAQSNSSQVFRGVDTTNVNRTNTRAYSTGLLVSQVIAWNLDNVEAYIKVYYRGK